VSGRAGSPLKPWSYFPLGLRAYRDLFRFTGRARRLEIAEFYIVSMFLNLATRLLFDTGWIRIETGTWRSDILTNRLAEDAVLLLTTLPFFALMARRIQDFGMPGWAFAPLLPYVFAVNMWEQFAAISTVEAPSWQFQLPAFAIVVVMMIAWFIPGTEGPNRYGADPRLDPPAES
jgi:uncharacterized membrane protein YhaH (DUF805 family)